MKNPKISKCKSCKEKKKILCKSLCSSCYRVAYRKTPSGIKATKNYNNGKGKEARKRWELKNPRPTPKPRGELNKNKTCKCGSVVLAKNLCQQCYYKNKNGITGDVRVRRRSKDCIITDSTFNELLELLIGGVPLYKALSRMGIHDFYTHATREQRQEVELYKSHNPNKYKF